MKTITNAREFVLLDEACGGLACIKQAAATAGVSRQRMEALVATGRLPAWQWNGVCYVSVAAAEKWARLELKAGRPGNGCIAATITLSDILTGS